MNEQLQNALAEIIQKAITTGEAAAEFLVAETPDVVYQLLLWYGVKTGLLCLTGLMLVSANVYMALKILKNPRGWYIDEYGYMSVAGIAFTIASVFFMSIGGALFFENHDWLQILIAPKIWLLEYAAELVK